MTPTAASEGGRRTEGKALADLRALVYQCQLMGVMETRIWVHDLSALLERAERAEAALVGLLATHGQLCLNPDDCEDAAAARVALP